MCFKVCMLLLVASGAFASSQICVPDQFEGVSVTTTGYSISQYHGITRNFVNHYYDYTNSRQTTLTVRKNAGVTDRNLVVIHYSGQKGTQYMVDLDTKMCVSSPLNTPFQKLCLPDGSTQVGHGDLGPVGSLPVLFYTAQMNTTTMEIAVTKHGNGYLPVKIATYGSENGVSFYAGTAYYNMTTGIKDPSIFDIPHSCNKTNVPQKSSASIFGF